LLEKIRLRTSIKTLLTYVNYDILKLIVVMNGGVMTRKHRFLKDPIPCYSLNLSTIFRL